MEGGRKENVELREAVGKLESDVEGERELRAGAERDLKGALEEVGRLKGEVGGLKKEVEEREARASAAGDEARLSRGELAVVQKELAQSRAESGRMGKELEAAYGRLRSQASMEQGLQSDLDDAVREQARLMGTLKSLREKVFGSLSELEARCGQGGALVGKYGRRRRARGGLVSRLRRRRARWRLTRTSGLCLCRALWRVVLRRGAGRCVLGTRLLRCLGGSCLGTLWRRCGS